MPEAALPNTAQVNTSANYIRPSMKTPKLNDIMAATLHPISSASKSGLTDDMSSESYLQSSTVQSFA